LFGGKKLFFLSRIHKNCYYSRFGSNMHQIVYQIHCSGRTYTPSQIRSWLRGEATGKKRGGKKTEREKLKENVEERETIPLF